MLTWVIKATLSEAPAFEVPLLTRAANVRCCYVDPVLDVVVCSRPTWRKERRLACLVSSLSCKHSTTSVIVSDYRVKFDGRRMLSYQLIPAVPPMRLPRPIPTIAIFSHHTFFFRSFSPSPSKFLNSPARRRNACYTRLLLLMTVMLEAKHISIFH